MPKGRVPFVPPAGTSNVIKVPTAFGPWESIGAWASASQPVRAFAAAAVAIAALRFVRTAKNIDPKELRPGTGSRIDIALAGLLGLLGCALFFYLSPAIVMKL